MDGIDWRTAERSLPATFNRVNLANTICLSVDVPPQPPSILPQPKPWGRRGAKKMCEVGSEKREVRNPIFIDLRQQLAYDLANLSIIDKFQRTYHQAPPRPLAGEGVGG